MSLHYTYTHTPPHTQTYPNLFATPTRHVPQHTSPRTHPLFQIHPNPHTRHSTYRSRLSPHTEICKTDRSNRRAHDIETTQSHTATLSRDRDRANNATHGRKPHSIAYQTKFPNRSADHARTQKLALFIQPRSHPARYSLANRVYASLRYSTKFEHKSKLPIPAFFLLLLDGSKIEKKQTKQTTKNCRT